MELGSLLPNWQNCNSNFPTRNAFAERIHTCPMLAPCSQPRGLPPGDSRLASTSNTKAQFPQQVPKICRQKLPRSPSGSEYANHSSILNPWTCARSFCNRTCYRDAIPQPPENNEVTTSLIGTHRQRHSLTWRLQTLARNLTDQQEPSTKVSLFLHVSQMR